MMEELLNVTSETYNKTDAVNLLCFFDRDRLSAQIYCDVIINSGERELKAHKLVLMAQSTFFKRKLNNKVKTDSLSNVILEFDRVTTSSVCAIVDYIYTNNITITSQNVFDVAYASNYFEMSEVKKFCFDFLKTHLTSNNCIKTINFARSFNATSLEEAGTEYLYKNFKFVTKTTSFLELDLQEFAEIIHPTEPFSIKVCESLIFEAIVMWVKEKDGRSEYFLQLYQLVKLDRLKFTYLANHVGKEELVRSSLPCLQMLTEASGSSLTNHKFQGDDNDASLTDEQLQCKLVNQRTLFTKYFKDESNQSWFVVSSEWLDKWTRYVTNDGYDWDSQMRPVSHPGPIDSANLFTNHHCRMLKDTIKPITDYKFVTELAWLALVEWYGITEGQPPINEKGPVLDNDGLGRSIDDILVIDPVKILFAYDYNYDNIVTKHFSKWMLLSDAEKEMRDVFDIPKDVSTHLQHGLMPIDSTKCFQDYKSSLSKVFVLVAGSAVKLKAEFQEYDFKKALVTTVSVTTAATTTATFNYTSQISRSKNKDSSKTQLGFSTSQISSSKNKDSSKPQFSFSTSLTSNSKNKDSSKPQFGFSTSQTSRSKNKDSSKPQFGFSIQNDSKKKKEKSKYVL